MVIHERGPIADCACYTFGRAMPGTALNRGSDRPRQALRVRMSDMTVELGAHDDNERTRIC